METFFVIILIALLAAGAWAALAAARGFEIVTQGDSASSEDE